MCTREMLLHLGVAGTHIPNSENLPDPESRSTQDRPLLVYQIPDSSSVKGVTFKCHYVTFLVIRYDTAGDVMALPSIAYDINGPDAVM